MTAIAMTADAFDDDEPAPHSRLLRFAIGLAALAATAGAVWGFFRVSGDQPVARLHIEGELQRVSPAEIDAAVRPLLDASFVQVDLDAVHTAVIALPWVGRVRVERVWPATVRLRVWERVPVARWGEDRLLDADGSPFTPDGREVPPSLPQLSAEAGNAAVVLGMFRQLAARLDNTAFALAGLNQDARGDWTGRTASGIELRFGRGDPSQALDTLLGPAARALADRTEEIEHVDLRYTNGFSVGWRKPVADTKRN